MCSLLRVELWVDLVYNPTEQSAIKCLCRGISDIHGLLDVGQLQNEMEENVHRSMSLVQARKKTEMYIQEEQLLCMVLYMLQCRRNSSMPTYNMTRSETWGNNCRVELRNWYTEVEWRGGEMDTNSLQPPDFIFNSETQERACNAIQHKTQQITQPHKQVN